MITQKDKIKYYKRKKNIGRVILRNAKKRGHVVYGARAVNQQVKKHLEKDTQDYDIYSNTPKITAHRVEKQLDNNFGGNYFKTEEAIHPGTWKVKSNIDSQGWADYSKTPPKIKTVTRRGVKYAHTDHQLKQIKKSLADKESKFRHAKDIETRQRIALDQVKERKKRKIISNPFSLNKLNIFK